MKIGHRRIGTDEAPLVIGEIGISHEGQIGKALQLVDAAADAGTGRNLGNRFER